MGNPATSGESAERFASRLLTQDFLLWSPNIQAEAFLNWGRLWATRSIVRGIPRAVPRTTMDLELTFASGGIGASSCWTPTTGRRSWAVARARR
jgi:hypothetical protein